MHFSEPKRLTPLQASFTSVAFSPNGERIAFACECGRRCAIYLIERNGRNPIRLAGQENARCDTYWDLQFSPDGTFLVCVVSEGDGEFSDLCRIDIATTKQTRLTQNRRSGSPCLNPDGRYVVFHSWGDCVTDLFQVAVDGGEIIRLTHTERSAEVDVYNQARNNSPQYSPDGEWIVFASSVYDGKPNQPLQVCVMRADGSEVTRLTDMPQGIDHPMWHPTGKQIAFTVKTDLPKETGRRLWKYRSNLHSVNMDGTGIRRLEFSDSVNHLGSFSPGNGRYLAYSTSGEERFQEGGRNWDIRLIDVTDTNISEVIVVTDNDVYDASPVFSPDGNSLLFVSERAADTTSDVHSRVTRSGDLYSVDLLP